MTLADNIIVPMLTFLLGYLASSLIYMSKFNDRLTKLETRQVAVVSSLEELKEFTHNLKLDVPPCQFHIDLDKRVVTLEAKSTI